jgi:hypothetical protein
VDEVKLDIGIEQMPERHVGHAAPLAGADDGDRAR